MGGDGHAVGHGRHQQEQDADERHQHVAGRDAAEEEETKEIILVYYHLLTSPDPLTPAQLDDRIERWMEEGRWG